MIPSNVEKFPQPLYPEVAQQFNRLWDLIWLGQGESNWRRVGDRPFETLVDWDCFAHKFRISSVKGDLPAPYKIRACAGTIELTLSDRHYQFYYKSEYGHFSVPNSIYLRPGSACYSDRWSDEPVKEFISAPFVNWKGQCRKSWLMTPETIAEVVDFVSDLCDRIESKNNSIRY